MPRPQSVFCLEITWLLALGFYLRFPVSKPPMQQLNGTVDVMHVSFSVNGTTYSMEGQVVALMRDFVDPDFVCGLIGACAYAFVLVLTFSWCLPYARSASLRAFVLCYMLICRFMCLIIAGVTDMYQTREFSQKAMSPLEVAETHCQIRSFSADSHRRVFVDECFLSACVGGPCTTNHSVELQFPEMDLSLPAWTTLMYAAGAVVAMAAACMMLCFGDMLWSNPGYFDRPRSTGSSVRVVVSYGSSYDRQVASTL
jgi:hypothetical protein